jgi:photosystem II stability/assembly factor-like uncharacterized protein
MRFIPRSALLLMVCAGLVVPLASIFAQPDPDAPRFGKADPDEGEQNDAQPEQPESPEGKDDAEKGDKDKDKDEKKDETPDPTKLTAGKFAAISARNLGPAIFSGRIADLAVNPRDHSEYYVAVASGGVWKTTNAGTTFSPIFDGYGSYSIGCVTLDPGNPEVVWVGTGENNSQRSVGWGDGVYVSRDGGRSFKNVGLKESEHVGMIAVDPRNSSRVFVAAQGPLWKDGGDRGLYLTSDGGATWEKVLNISDKTGISEVHLDPRDPDTVYAVAYQRRRHVFTLVNGGPECAVHKSSDGGKTWRKLSSGLPTGEGVGRIGMTISPADPNILYAIVEGNEAGNRGIYRSESRGESWEKRSGYVSSSPQYYQELFADPKDADTFYSADTFLHFTTDGGKTMRRVGESDKHVDNHAVWVDPGDTRHLRVGCDGGLYESFDRGANWRHFENLPVMQFYRVAVDDSKPFYYVYGGTQDNATIGGPSRTVERAGITNEDWFVTTGGDGFETAVEPGNPNIVYSESQHAGLVRFDRASGEEVDIRPMSTEDEKPYVWNWDTPLLISRHKPTRLYLACNYLLRSEDRGNSWTRISEDLTRGIDRNQLPVMGVIQKPDAVAKHTSTSIYGNAVSLDESPKVEGLLYVGTDDGLIHISEDGGKAWRKVESILGIPETTYVSDLTAGSHSADTVFACFDNHKRGDFAPYVLRSDDRGRSWKSVAGDLPKNCTAYCLVQDHVNEKLLFVATEFGCHFTLDGGEKWFKVSGMPTIAVRDLEIQKEHDDLVMASFGRGFFVIDDYSPLRTASGELFGEPAHIFETRPALAYVERARVGGQTGRGVGGASYYTARNPPSGATITYYLKEKLKTLKEKRKEAEKKEGWTYPTIEQFQAEDREQAPACVLIIRDDGGKTVRQIGASRDAGMHRATWNLRYAPTTPASLTRPERDPWDTELDGTLVQPGTYTVTLASVENGVATELAGPQEIEVVDLNNATLAVKGEARAAKFAFEREAAELQRAVEGAGRFAGEIRGKLDLMRQAAKDTPGVPGMGVEIMGEFEALRVKLGEIERELRGDPTYGARSVAEHPSISDRVGRAVGNGLSTTQPIPETLKKHLAIAGDQFEVVLAKLREVDRAVKELEAKLEAAGAPWTPGRVPEWKGR